MVAGGPVASFGLAGLLYGIYVWSTGTTTFSGLSNERRMGPFLLALGLLLTAAYSVYVGLASLYPHKMKSGHLSDGLQLINCWKHREATLNSLSVFMVHHPWTCGVRARDWPSDGIDRILTIDNSIKGKVMAHLLAYYHYLDSFRFSEALDQIREGLTLIQDEENVNGVALRSFVSECAYALAYLEQNPGAARAQLDRLSLIQSSDYQTTERAEAAILAAEGKQDEAKTVISQAIAKLDKEFEKGNRDSTLAELEFLRRIISQPMATPVGQTAG